MRILIAVALLLSCTIAYGADGVIYKDAIVVCKVKTVDEQKVLDLPFQVFGQNIVMNGKDVTYSLDKLKDGDEVMAKVDFKAEDEGKVKEFAIDKSSPLYLKHYPVTKAQALATYDKDEKVVPYVGLDKDELADFTVRCKNGI